MPVDEPPREAFAEIEYEVSDGVATIALNRPDDMNAGTTAMVSELLAAFDAVDRDDTVRTVILTGRGRAFCAGADLSGGADSFRAHRREAELELPVGRLGVPRDGAGIVTLRIFECKKPVIAAINGAAVGMGVTMTLAADIRMASEAARFGFVFGRRGIVPEGASTWFLPRLVGIARAAEWLYTGRVFDAEEALACGLVRSLHTTDTLLSAARLLADEIAESAPVPVALTRQMLWRLMGAAHPMDAHRADSRALQATASMRDAREGVMSFIEKRPADFTGRVSADMPEIFPDWIPPTY